MAHDSQEKAPPRSGKRGGESEGHGGRRDFGQDNTAWSCPDCGANAVGRHLTHDDACPLNRAAEARMAADRGWFRDHPGAQRYTRPIAADEIAELRRAGVLPDGWGAAGAVEVAQLAPGVRTRRFGACWMFPLGGAA